MRKRLIYQLDSGLLGMPGSRGMAAQCYRLGNLVCMTGQVAYTLDGQRLVGVGDPAAQTRQVMENIRALMAMAGGSLADVVKITTYVTDRAHREQIYPIIQGYFGDLKPCGTGVIVKGLAREEFLVEIDAWGFIDDPA